jgi:predicted PurR-regulated permease PerM
MARAESPTKPAPDGVPRARDVAAAPPGVPRGLGVAAGVAWRVLVVAAAVVATGYAVGKLLLVVLPVVVAVLLTTLLAPLARRIERRGTHPRAAALAVVGTAVVVLGVLLALIVPPFVSELGEVGTSVEKGSREAGKLLQPLGISQAQVDKAIDDGVKSLEGSGGKLAGGAVTGALNVLAATLLTLVLTFFFVKDGRDMWRWLVGLFGQRRRAGARDMGDRIWGVLTGYVHGIALVAVIDATLIGLTLVVMGIPLAMPLTVLTFLAAFFPVVGAVVVGVAAVLVALVAKGTLAAVVVAVAIVVVQQLDGNVLQPVFVGRKLELHPVVVLLALATGGVIAGIVGAFLAVPIAAVAGAALAHARARAS